MRRLTRPNLSERGRVLAIHRYFWPDSPPYAAMLRAIAGRWARDGARVEVVGTQPSYKSESEVPQRPWQETVDGVTVTRIRLLRERGSPLRRFANMLLFALVAACRVLHLNRNDVVMCSTSPPVLLSSLVAVAARIRGARFIYHCMDIHPEIGSFSGEFRNPLVFRLLRAADRATCRRAYRIVVLSRDMRTAVLERDSRLGGRVVVLNNFDLPQFPDSPASGTLTQRDPPPRKAELRLVFTGNVGRFQGLDDVIVAVLESAVDVELVIMGEGKAKRALQERVAGHPYEARVTFLPHGTPAEARVLMQSADAGLVSLAPGIVRYAYPSKTLTYLAEGLPLLVVAETGSELSRTVVNKQIGIAVDPGDRPAMERALRTLATRKTGLIEMRERARDFGVATFGTDHVLQQWAELLRSALEDEGELA